MEPRFRRLEDPKKRTFVPALAECGNRAQVGRGTLLRGWRPTPGRRNSLRPRTPAISHVEELLGNPQ
jgi:hypothetical protein